MALTDSFESKLSFEPTTFSKFLDSVLLHSSVVLASGLVNFYDKMTIFSKAGEVSVAYWKQY